MLQLELTSDERQILVDALETYVSDLRMEIADTEKHDVRNDLKRRKEVLRQVLNTLRG